MISQSTLNSITKLAYPGITIHYTELKDIKDTTTISDNNNEISKALSSNNLKDIGLIVNAIYKNSKYHGELVNDNGKIKLVSNGKVYDILVTNNGSVLKVKDTLNKKDTIIEYKSAPKQEVKISLQDQIMMQLKKRKMSDKEVIEFVKKLEKGLK